ncbi:MAG: M48 family metalloprotease [Porticoccaceae bacterium]|nr:M48 family metalloprotease [Porticoccaceae bacterium]
MLWIASFNCVAADINLPMLGDSSSGIVSKNQEYKLGKAWLQAFRRHVEQHDDPLIQAYLEQLTFDLVTHSDLDDTRLTLVLVNNPTINAFAVPGGIIGIHTGIFTHAGNEDQLASIISHELAHLSQRHFARGLEAQRSSMSINLAGLLATIILSSKAGSDAGIAALTASQALSADQQLRYSRNNEKEADRQGLKIMRNAGRDPRAASDMLEKMMALTRYSGSRLPEFLLTHPITQKRVSDTRSRTLKYQNRHYPDNYDFYIMRARTQVLHQNNATYSVKFFGQKLKENSLNNDAYHYGLAIANSKAGNHDAASQYLAELLRKKPIYAPYIYTDIEIDIAAGNYKSALKKLKLQLTFNETNYPLQVLQADVLWKSHQYQASASVLTQLSRKRPEDPSIWYQLAEVRGLAGDISGVHKARAEYFILIGALENAKRQLNFAKKLLQKDVKGLAIVEQRMVDIVAMEKNLKKL